MNYISSADAAKKWGISIVRVCVLAREGRIGGAQFVANRWLIPENAPKPAVKRIRTKRIYNPEKFYFPLWVCIKPADIFKYSDSTDEEAKLYKAQLLLIECRFQESITLLEEILNKTETPIIRIIALYCLCIALIYFGDIERLKSTLFDLQLTIESSFPDHKELLFLVNDIEASYKGNKSYIDLYDIDPSYPYPRETFPYLYLTSSYAMFVSKASNPNLYDAAPYELSCHLMEQEGYLFAAERMHLYISLYYYMCKNNEKSIYHFHRTIELAMDLHDYLCLAEMYQTFGTYIDEQLSTFPDKSVSQIRNAIKDYFEHFQKFNSSLYNSTAFFNLSFSDYNLIYRSILGDTAQKIANDLNISSRTVTRRFKQIYERLGVKNREEMIDYYYKMLNIY